MTVTITFTVPEKCRRVFRYELELILHQLEPLTRWLTRHGGQLTIS